ncbi:MAG: O-antigen ligase family protein [Chthonomonadaceae bacterium]|nr:O-antigen ligase family protein [Chthonomonadaceae bacterium]
MKWPRAELALLLLAAFLAPLVGGHVSLDATPATGPWITSLFWGPTSPFGTRAVLGTLLALSFIISVRGKRFVQVPSLPLLGALTALVFWTGCTSLWSSFPYASYSTWLNWILFGLALVATVSSCGRQSGVRALLTSLVVGAVLVAINGVTEYSAMKALDPGYRVFGGWNNPNALAGLLASVAPLAAGLSFSKTRLVSLSASVATAIIVFCLMLTQSKGGMIALCLGLIGFVTLGFFWTKKISAAKPLVPVAVAIALVLALFVSNKAPGGAAPLARVMDPSVTSQQSAGFRVLLWKGSVQLVADRPLGSGPGTYRFESAKPGLTEQTVHAHQTVLQTAVEVGLPGVVLLLAVIGLWFVGLFKDSRNWPDETKTLRACMFGSVVAACVDGLFESNLIYTGSGIVMFLVMGAGLQLTATGSSPEAAPKPARLWMAGLVGCVSLLMFWHTAFIEGIKSASSRSIVEGQTRTARDDLAFAMTLAPNDGETAYLAAKVNPDERLTLLQRAVALAPRPLYYRALSREYLRAGRPTGAVGALKKALSWDPNNLSTLEALYQTQGNLGQEDDARATAERLISVEETPYLQVRALPELVPLEPADARVYLADQGDRAEQNLSGALETYKKYMSVSAPYIISIIGNDPKATLAGHGLDEIESVRQKGLAVIQRLTNMTADPDKLSNLTKDRSLFEPH